jgi:Carboxypeptidase regulatory-like domain
MMLKAIALVVVAECAQAPPPAPPRHDPPPLQSCTSHHVHGVIRDADGKPVGKTQVSLVGGEGQDDATTDDDGRFDLASTTTARDQLVVFYGDGNVTRALSSTTCDERIDMRISSHNSQPLTL